MQIINELSSQCVKNTLLQMLELKLCFNCLGDHSYKDCKSKKTCRICKKKHHTSLCFTPIVHSSNRQLPPSDSKRRAYGNKGGPSIQLRQQKPPPSVSFTSTVSETPVTSVLEHSDYFTGTTIHHIDNYNNISTLPLNDYSLETLLMCAYITVSNPNLIEKSMTVLAFFDSSSNRSYISSDLATKLELSSHTVEKLQINTFANKSPTTLHTLNHSLNIHFNDKTWRTIPVTSLDTMTPRLHFIPISHDNPSILIGSNYMWDILDGYSYTALPSGFLLLDTKNRIYDHLVFLDPLSWDRAGFDRQYLSHPDYNLLYLLVDPSRTFGASADSIPLVPPRSPIIDPLPFDQLKATISNCKSLTEQHSFPEQDRELREYCIRRITQLQLAIVKIATASSLVSKSVEEMQAIITNSKTRAQRKEHLSEILVITEEIPYQKTLAEATELTFTLDARIDEGILELTINKYNWTISITVHKCGIARTDNDSTYKQTELYDQVTIFSQDIEGSPNEQYESNLQQRHRKVQPLRIKVPEFSGKVEEWEEFWAIYEDMLSVMEKIILLKDSLKEKPTKTIKGIQ
uniref:DUF1758 domain-containing protein n=1 Tax=Heterorhabditis bacteriophora TaxID=37862 RepID=A0A1I7WK07_HETBA